MCIKAYFLKLRIFCKNCIDLRKNYAYTHNLNKSHFGDYLLLSQRLFYNNLGIK